jgi:hypothetical protein
MQTPTTLDDVRDAFAQVTVAFGGPALGLPMPERVELLRRLARALDSAKPAQLRGVQVRKERLWPAPWLAHVRDLRQHNRAVGICPACTGPTISLVVPEQDREARCFAQVLFGGEYGIDREGRLRLQTDDSPLVWAKCALPLNTIAFRGAPACSAGMMDVVPRLIQCAPKTPLTSRWMWRSCSIVLVTAGHAQGVAQGSPLQPV